MFGWFNARDAEEFGRSLAEFLVRQVPADPGKLTKKMISRQAEVVDDLYKRIDEFKSTHRLNIYKKAKLGGAFRDVLVEAGHKTAFVEQMTKGVLQRVAGR